MRVAASPTAARALANRRIAGPGNSSWVRSSASDSFADGAAPSIALTRQSPCCQTSETRSIAHSASCDEVA